MPESDDDMAEQLRRELLRQSPEFDVHTSLPGKVSARVRRRQRLRMTLVLVAAAAVVAAVAIPLSSLRSQPLGRRIAPVTAPTSSTSTPTSSTTTPPVTVAPLSCGALNLQNVADGTVVSTTATLGGATATLTGTKVTAIGQDTALSKPEVSIILAGGGSFAEAVGVPSQATAVIPWSIAPASPSAASPSQTPVSEPLCLVESPGQSLPTLLLGLDTGGAHCCTVLRAVTLAPTGFGPALDDDLGNPGASLSPDGDHALIVTADNSFAYAFTSYAFSGMPLKVLELSHGSFVDVTKLHLDRVRTDAATWMTAFNANPGNGLGVLAAWVADQCLLGQGTSAWTTVNQMQGLGKLVGPAGWPTGTAYVAALEQFLSQHGYCSS